MAVTHGMNIAEVESLAVRLREAAGRVEQISGALEREVHSVGWRGPDAERYRSEWWPGHRRTLGRVAEDLRGFGQSAANNAEEQRQISTSSGGAGTSSGVARAGVAGMAAAVGAVAGGAEGSTNGGAASGSAASGAAADRPGASTGQLPGAGRTWGQVQSDYSANAAAYGLKPVHQPGGGLEDQCVAWATYRWQELREAAGMELSHVPQESGLHGGKLAGAFGGVEGATPKLGAMVSYPAGDYGHVMIVEEIGQRDGAMTVTVSEFNVPDGSGQSALETPRTFTQRSDGQWVSPGKQVHSFTVANP